MTRIAQTEAMADAANRPEWFDEKLLSYMPAIKSMAKRFFPSDPEEMAQEASMFFLRQWRSYRPDGGFYNWISLNMRALAQAKRNKNVRFSQTFVHDPDGKIAATIGDEARQHHYAEASQVIDIANGTPQGRVVVRRAMGDELKTIAIELGISIERVRQIEMAGRRRLVKQLRAVPVRAAA
jgi:RNA polymerase sigma factor (sigma-70 family)